GCNVLMPTGALSRYVMAVYNTSTSPLSTSAFQVASDGRAPASPAPAPAAARAPVPSPAQRQAQQQEDAHLRIMEMNRREND
ncbi:hypothetical protein OVW19_30755, partial [Klebsiella pneumoniae]|nr:hypothetical protein [Klebsiella pneumoniae]